MSSSQSPGVDRPLGPGQWLVLSFSMADMGAHDVCFGSSIQVSEESKKLGVRCLPVLEQDQEIVFLSFVFFF